MTLNPFQQDHQGGNSQSAERVEKLHKKLLKQASRRRSMKFHNNRRVANKKDRTQQCAFSKTSSQSNSHISMETGSRQIARQA